MSDLRTLLTETADSSVRSPSTSAAVADEHLVHARRALRRRNARRLSVGSSLAVVAAVGAFALGGTTRSSAPPAAVPSPTTTSGVQLVDYHGAQPAGYTLDKVPAGWQIDDNEPSILTLAPRGTASDDAPDGSVSLVGKIAISSQTDTGVPTGVQLDEVTVGGRPGVIAHMDGGDGRTRTIFVKQPSGAYLQIQVWGGLGWDNQEIATFAASVHITSGAVPVVG